ncbi:MAG: helix-turn-helix transcriptional regulator [Ruminococcus sp.]|nr:helix-turn-helix transcriptional regulator [Ruminococcus sp.]
MDTKDRLKELRKSRNLKGQEVADGCGMAYKVYQAYESGARNLGVPALEKLADFYGVSTDYLLGRSTEEKETLDELAGEFNMSLLEKKILEGYLELPRDLRGDFMDFLYKAVQEVKQESES